MQKLHLKKNLQSAGMILGLSAMLFSCSEVISGNDDNPVAPQKTENEKVEFTSTGAKITAESASEATTLFLTLVEDIKTKGVGEGKEYVIDIVGSNVQSGSDISLTVPMVVGANLNLRFEKAFNEGTTLTINASETSSDSKESVNKLAITIPSADKLSLNVNMPETTVTLKSPEGVTTYRDVVSRTATNTLIVDEGVTVNNVDVLGGTVQINEGGILDSWTFAAENNGDQVLVKEDGGIEPIKTANDQWLIANENGQPYYATSLKIAKGDADYSVVWFGNASNTAIPLKTVVVCDDAVLQTNYIAMENIEGEDKGTGVIKYRFTSLPGFTDDSEYGGIKFYEWNSDISGVKNVKKITFSQPEIAPDAEVKSMVQEKEAEGYLMNEPRLNMDVDGNVEDCTFNYNHVFFCNTHSYECPIVKNCKFVHVNHEADLNDYHIKPVDSDIIEFQLPIVYDGSFDSNSITFENCEFSEGTKFWGYFFAGIGNNAPDEWFDGDVHFTGYINFKNCKLGGKNMIGDNTDFIKELWANSGTRFIISFDDVPKYEVVWDSEKGGYVANVIE